MSDMIILTHPPLHSYARLIRNNWKKVSVYASPYLDAMAELNSIDSMFYCDDGRSVINYFLSNAQGWRGEIARAVKAELKEIVSTGSYQKKSILEDYDLWMVQ